MAFVPSFKYDIFISYAHIDNATVDKAEKGWITRFYQELKLLVATRVGRTDIAQIWWDERLSHNTVFNDEIRDAVQNSALLITFSSNGYYESAYCKDELTSFYKNAAGNKSGLAVNNKYRIYNIRLNKIGNEKWPAECQGATGYDMYELLNEDTDKLGYPTDPNSPLFKRKLQELTNDIYDTMLQMKSKAISISESSAIVQKPEMEIKAKVFFAKVSDTLLNERNQIIRELETNNIGVIKKVLPPPYAKQDYEREVKKSLEEACLSIHLFDDIAGDEIEENSETFTQAQVSIAKSEAKEQLIFIPKELDFDHIENERHKHFLQNLQNNKTESDKYRLIREIAPPNIALEIIEKVNKLINQPKLQSFDNVLQKSPGVFLDFHQQDFMHALNLNNLLGKRGITTFLCSSGSNASGSIENFETALKESVSMIFILGSVAKEWVIERYNTAREIIYKNDYPVLSCAIYLAPKTALEGNPIKRKQWPPQLLDDSKSSEFNADTVIPFLQQIA